MKVRISIPGSYVTMELEEDRATAIFKDLSAKLLGIEPAGKVQIRPRIKILNENQATVSEVEQQQIQEALEAKMKDFLKPEEAISITGKQDANQAGPEALAEISVPATADTPPLEADNKPAKAYRGFLYIHCESCGRTKGFCVKEPINAHKCSCGHEIPLKDLVTMWVHCECGKRFKYQTNMDEFLFDVNCINCGSPVPVKWNKGKRLYETIKD